MSKERFCFFHPFFCLKIFFFILYWQLFSLIILKFHFICFSLPLSLRSQLLICHGFFFPLAYLTFFFSVLLFHHDTKELGGFVYHWTSWICGLVSFFSFDEFSTSISSNVTSATLSVFPFSRTPIKHVLDFLILFSCPLISLPYFPFFC